MKKIIFTLFITFSIPVIAASFDCAKASTPHEKLICASPALSDADTQMGDAYKATNKSFPISGFIQDNQRAWLSSYRSCKDVSKCVELVNSRIKELNRLKNGTTYADYEGNKLIVQEGTIVITDEGSVKTAKFFGNWMTDAFMDPNKIKGYPKDGQICDEDIVLVKKGNTYVAKEGSVSDDFSLLIDASKVVMKGTVMCSARCTFGAGTYKKK